jgi:hypothetical protein
MDEKMARRRATNGVLVPKPLLLVVDDVGWRSGADGSADGVGAWRAGVARQHTDEDYLALAELGRSLKMRPQCGMILCDWDRERACAKQPTTTWLGAEYENEQLGDGKWAESAAALMLDKHAAHLEFTLHGVGHERWDWSDDGVHRSRSEWYGAAHRNPQWQDHESTVAGRHWPLADLEGHVACFTAIMRQYQIMGFPETFVPTGFCYSWHADTGRSTGHFMRTQGVKLCTNPFDVTTFSGGKQATRPPIDGGFDHGLLVLDRGRYSDRIPFNAVATVPRQLPPLDCSVCGIHFVNMLALDKQDNASIVKQYTAYFEEAGTVAGRVLSRNSLELASQWLHHAYTSLEIVGASGSALTVSLDSQRLPQEASPLIGPAVLQLVDTAVVLGNGDDEDTARPSRRRLTEVRVPQGSVLRPVAVWEHCGHSFISVTTIDTSRSNHRSDSSMNMTSPRPSGTLELAFEEASRKRRRKTEPAKSWPVARLMTTSNHEDCSASSVVLPLVLRSEDTMMLNSITTHHSEPLNEDADSRCADYVVINCVVYGTQRIDIMLPFRPLKVSEISGQSAHIALELRSVAAGVIAESYVATVVLKVVGRWVNG